MHLHCAALSVPCFFSWAAEIQTASFMRENSLFLQSGLDCLSTDLVCCIKAVQSWQRYKSPLIKTVCMCRPLFVSWGGGVSGWWVKSLVVSASGLKTFRFTVAKSHGDNIESVMSLGCCQNHRSDWSARQIFHKHERPASRLP